MAWCPTAEPFGRPFATPYTRARARPRLRPWRHVLIAQVVKRYERRRVVATERRLIEGTPARVETLRRRAQGDGVINTAYIERLNATFRERLASLTRRGRALARHTLTFQHGMYLIGTVYNFCTPHASWPMPVLRQHRRWLLVSRIIAGVCENSCRITCRYLVGPHPTNVGLPHVYSNAWLSGGAVTTVKCGATR